MKFQKTFIASLLCLSAVPFANAAEFEDFARVVSVTPQMQQYSQPRQECRTVMVPVAQQARDPSGAIVGGIIGGVLGNQIGRGSGRGAATAVGVVGVAVVGDQIANQNNPTVVGERPVQECRTVEGVSSRAVAFEVTYTYHGQTFTSVLPYDPGKRVKVRVAVNPL